jgi:hypothetical protein
LQWAILEILAADPRTGFNSVADGAFDLGEQLLDEQVVALDRGDGTKIPEQPPPGGPGR